MTTKQNEETKAGKTATWGNPPAMGQRYLDGRIVRVLDFGTMDVERPDGTRYRVSGLGWGLLCAADDHAEERRSVTEGRGR